jgi:hypothetical protein
VGATGKALAGVAAMAIAGCGGGSGGPGHGVGARQGRPQRGVGEQLPPHYRLAVRLPTVVSHELGSIGYRCAGPRYGLAIGGPVAATEFARFRDSNGGVRLAGNVNHAARGPMLRVRRQSLEIVVAVEPGTAVVDVEVEFPRAPCEVQRMRVRIASNQNVQPGSPAERRVDRLGQLALRPHQSIDSH